MEKTYFACDLKSFYSSVECVERGLDPLTTKLVVADSSRTSKTICLAVTPALKKYGLSGRSRLFEVEQKAKQLLRETGEKLEYIIAPPRMALYIDYSARIYNIYLKYFSPEDIHVYSIDEVFVDFTSYLSLYKMNARELAMKVIQNILSETGITATAGIAPNLYLCKIAMDIVAKHIPADKDGVRIAELSEDTYRKELWDHKPITDFWRVGPGTAKRLSKYGMYTMGDIARRSLTRDQDLYKLFGIDAEILIDHAWGYEPCSIKDIKGYKSSHKCIGSGQVLSCGYTNEKARIVVREMAEALAFDLFQKQLVTSSLTLFINYDREIPENYDYKGNVKSDHWGRDVPENDNGTIRLGECTDSASIITDKMLELFERICDPNLLVKKLNVTANDVMPKKEKQPQLFDVDELMTKKEDNLQKAKMEIMKKFGKNAILKGTDLEEGATTIERNSQIGGHKA